MYVYQQANAKRNSTIVYNSWNEKYGGSINYK